MVATDLANRFGCRYEKSSCGNIPIVDGHLDLAENGTIFGCDLTLDVSGIRAIEIRKTNQATVSLPELKRGGIAVAFATVTGDFEKRTLAAALDRNLPFIAHPRKQRPRRWHRLICTYNGRRKRE